MSDWPAGVARLHYPDIDSTNAEGLRRLAAGAAAPLWLTADRQTAARGRRGRPWRSPAGNFHGTLALRLTCPPAEAALRTFSAALSVMEALEAQGLAPGRIALKWPNDVLVDGRKIAGILLESAAHKDALHLVLGIGVNLCHRPDPADLPPGAVPPISLAEAGHRADPRGFLTALACAFARWEAVQAAQGFAPVRAAWLARAARLGQQIVARLPGEEIHGTLETVDDTGALVLETPHGRRHLAAAEVFFEETHHASGH